MTTEQKNQAIEILKQKFSQYSNFYVTDMNFTDRATNQQTAWFMFQQTKVAKNTLIVKA